jgi:hypothetical protein
LLVLRAFRHDGVGLLDACVFDVHALRRELVGLVLVQPPHPSEGMKSDDERNSAFLLQAQGDQRRHEEVRVHQMVIAVFAGEVAHVSVEVLHQRQEIFLAHELRRAGGHVHHTQARLHLDDTGQVGAVASREDVYNVTEPREMPRDLRDVDVLPAAVDSARGRERRSVFTDDCNLPGQGTTSVPRQTAVVVPIDFKLHAGEKAERFIYLNGASEPQRAAVIRTAACNRYSNSTRTLSAR